MPLPLPELVSISYLNRAPRLFSFAVTLLLTRTVFSASLSIPNLSLINLNLKHGRTDVPIAPPLTRGITCSEANRHAIV